MFEFDSDIEEEYLDTIIQNELHGEKGPKVTSKETLPDNPINADVCGKNNSENMHKTKVNDQAHVFRRNVASVTVERRFPGPAGLLPEKRNARLPLTSDPSMLTDSQNENCIKTKSLHVIQKWQNSLESLAWSKILKDLETEASGKEILKNINIKKIKEKASARLLVDKKVPFLVVVLNEIDLSFPDPSITMCDQTGVMNGTLHRDTWKEFEDELLPGCVLILRNVGVLTFGNNPHKNQHYLNITSNNLAGLYYNQEDEVRIIDIIPFDSNEMAVANKIWISNTIPVTSCMPSITDTAQRLFSSPLTALNNASYNTSLNDSPRFNRIAPMRSTPSTTENCAIKETNTNQRNSPAQSNYRQPLFSPIVKKRSTCQSTTNSDSVRNASTILNLLSNNRSSCDSFRETESTNTRTSDSYSNNKDIFNRKSVINKTSVAESENDSFPLDSNSKNSNNKASGKAFETNGVRRHNENRFSFNFSPKVARLESPKINHVSSNIEQNNCKVVSKQINVGNFVPSENFSDDQWEVNSILSSIDSNSFFEEDF